MLLEDRGGVGKPREHRGAGGGAHVRSFCGTDTTEVMDNFFAFGGGVTGGVRVAMADVNADGRDDCILGAGLGGGSEVRIRDCRTGTLMDDFFADDPAALGGVFVG